MAPKWKEEGNCGAKVGVEMEQRRTAPSSSNVISPGKLSIFYSQSQVCLNFQFVPIPVCVFHCIPCVNQHPLLDKLSTSACHHLMSLAN